MPDLALIKRNVAKMASMKAPESDIDGYIAQSGTTVDAVRDFKPVDKIFSKFPNRLQSGLSEYFGDTVKNIPKSAGRFVSNAKEILPVVGHPLDVAKGVVGTAVGLEEKYNPWLGLLKRARLVPQELKQEKYANAAIQGMKERYGSLQKAAQTFHDDPVGFAADISMLLGGAGGAVTRAGEASKLSRLASAGRFATKAGEIADPVGMALKTAGKGMELATKGRSIAPFAGKVNNEAVQAAGRVGVELPASAKTTSKAVPALEALAGKGLFGGDMVGMVERAHQGLEKFANAVIAKTGVASDLTSAGKAVSEGADRFRKAWFETKRKLYEKAIIPVRGTPGGVGKPVTEILVNPLKTREVVTRVLAEKERAAAMLGKSDDIGYFRNLKTKLGKPISGRYFHDAIRELNNKMLNFNDPITTGNKAVMKELVATMDSELDSAISTQRPELKAAIDKANAHYKQGLDRMNSEYGRKISNLAESGQYDKIIPSILNKSTSSEDISKIYEMIGQDKVPHVQSAFLEDFLKESKKNDRFTPEGITKQIHKYGDDKLQKILTTDQYAAVKDLETLSKGLGSAEKIASGSQTAFIARLAVEFSSAFTHPVMAMKAILGDALFSKFISSQAGQQFLTSGIKMTGKTGQRIQSVAPVVGKSATATRTAGALSEASPS